MEPDRWDLQYAREKFGSAAGEIKDVRARLSRPDAGAAIATGENIGLARALAWARQEIGPVGPKDIPPALIASFRKLKLGLNIAGLEDPADRAIKDHVLATDDSLKRLPAIREMIATEERPFASDNELEELATLIVTISDALNALPGPFTAGTS